MKYLFKVIYQIINKKNLLKINKKV